MTTLTTPILSAPAAAAKLMALVWEGAPAKEVAAAKAELSLAIALAPGGSLGGWAAGGSK